MDGYHDPSYFEPDEASEDVFGKLPPTGWPSHMVPPQASWVDEHGKPWLGHASDALLGRSRTNHLDRPLGKSLDYTADDMLDEEEEGPSLLPSRSSNRIASARLGNFHRSNDAEDLDFDPQMKSDLEESDSDSFSTGDDSEEDLREFESRLDHGSRRGRGRGRMTGDLRATRTGRGKAGFKGQLARIDEGLGLLGKEHRRGRPRKNNTETRMPRRKAGRRQRKKDALPSFEFRQLHEEASRAYIEGNYERAEVAISQAIEKNPEISTVHSLLAEILEAKGEKIRAPWVLFAGAHVRPREPQAWLEAADGIREFMGRQTPEEMLQMIQVDENTTVTLQEQCTNYLLHCYGQAITLDRNSHAARKRRATLLRDLGHPKKALKDYRYLIEHKAFDVFRSSDALEFVVQEYLRMSEPNKGIVFFEIIIDSHQDQDNLLEMLDWGHVSLLIELYLMANTPDKALGVVKKFARILLGRPDEDFWDDVTQDDREFDLEDEPRRCEVPGFETGRNPKSSYGAAMPLDIRIKIGLLRIQNGDLEEALQHFDWIRYNSDATVVEDFSDLYLEVAKSLHDAGHYAEAVTFYEPLQSIGFQMDGLDIDRLARCYGEVARYDEAEELYLKLAEENVGNLVSIEHLAKMFGHAGLHERAEPYLKRLSEERRKRFRSMEFPFGSMQASRRRTGVEVSSTDDDDDSDDDLPLYSASTLRTILSRPVSFGWKDLSNSSRRLRLPKAQGINVTLKQQLEALDEEQVLIAFEEMRVCEKNPDENEQDWIVLASKVIGVFKTQKVFYPYDRHQRFWGYSAQARSLAMKAKAEQDLLEKELRAGKLDKSIDLVGSGFESIPTEFCSVPFTEWLDTFLKYAVCMAARRRFEEAFETCQAAFDANVFCHSKSAVERIHYIWAACAALSDEEETISDVARDLMKEHQYVSDSYRLYCALNLVKRSPNHIFNGSNNQKFILRHIKAMDWALLSEQERLDRKEELSTRARYSRIDPETEEPILPTEVNCELLMTYALMLFAGQSHYEALVYMIRVYALHPDDPLLNFLMGLSHIASSFKRQSTNRQFQVMQGLAMITRYHEMRMASEHLIDRQEAVFNMGRSYQLLGLTHLSVPYYEKCLQMGEEIETSGGGENFAIEAAFALQSILAAQGQMERAEKITERWLVL